MSSVASMAGALLYLRVTSLLGRVKSRLRRLQQPKYLAGALVGAAYVYLTFIRRSRGLHAGYHPGPDGAGGPGDAGGVTGVLGFLPELGAFVLLVAVVVNWAMPRRAVLTFSEAEIAFLFPAPVNRRMLVHYRLLSSQVAIVFTSLILTVVFGRGRGFGGNPWFHAVGWWLILATMNLHFTGTSFVYSRLLNRSLTSGGRKVATIAAMWVVASVLIAWAWSEVSLPRPADPGRFAGGFASSLRADLHVGPLPWLLAIPKLLVAPYFAGSVSAFLLALGPALAVLVAHYFWVVHTEVSFEEASIARAEKHAARTRRVQQGDWRGQGTARRAQRSPFNLRDSGRPELAFLWKNLLSTPAFFRLPVAVGVIVIVVGGSEWLVRHPALQGARFFILMVFGSVLVCILLLGPMMARQDLRADLRNSDILKTYPLHGWQIVLGELLTPLSILSSFVWVCLLGGALLAPWDKVTWLTSALRLEVGLGLAVLAPLLVAIQLLVPNAAAIVFPAWAQSAADHTERGIEVLGQRIIFIVGQLLITLVAVVPAAICAALAFFAAQGLAGPLAAVPLAAAAAFVLLCAEAWLGIRWLGGRFEHFDLSAMS